MKMANIRFDDPENLAEIGSKLSRINGDPSSDL
jgi:hypothetical protein